MEINECEIDEKLAPRDEKLAVSIGRKLVIQAIKDLTSDDKDTKTSALKFFFHYHHKRLCEQAGIPPGEIRASVLEAVKHLGVRRKKLVGDILKELDK